MQFVDVTAGPIERSFGLATVRMHTAAAASDARVPGLPAAEAGRLRDNLTALGEARPGALCPAPTRRQPPALPPPHPAAPIGSGSIRCRRSSASAVPSA